MYLLMIVYKLGDKMEIGIIKAVQGIANSFLDVVFWLITKMGEEMFFLLIFVGFYLLYSKKFAFKFTIYYLISVGVNGVVKLIIRRPRPYVASSEIIDRLHASEFSFPSGHSQGYFVEATTSMQELGKSNTRKWLKITVLSILSVLGICVMVSRLYWGQHYPSDVIVGAMFGIALPFIIDIAWKLVPNKIKDWFTVERFCKILLAIGVVGFIIFLILDFAFGISSRKVYIFLGMYTALSLGYLIDSKYIGYKEISNKKTFWIKFIITYALLVAIYLPCSLLFGYGKIVYYFVFLFIGAVVSLLLPYLFKLILTRHTDTKIGTTQTE